MNMSTRSSLVPSSQLLKRRGALGELEMERVYPFEDLFRLVHAVAALLSECAQTVPLVANCLAPGVDLRAIPVVKRVQLLCNGGNLLNAVLVSCQVGLERLVLLLHGLQLENLAVLVVLRGKH